MSMNILHIYKSYTPGSYGGVEQTLHQLISGIEKYPINCRLLVVNEKNQATTIESSENKNGNIIGNVKTYRYKRSFEIASTPFSWEALCNYAEHIKWCDLIHYHYPWPFADLMHFLNQPKKPAIVTYHSDIVRQKKMLWIYRPLMNNFFNKVQKIIATSPNYLATSPVLQKFNSKVEIIPIGLNINTYPPGEAVRKNFWQQKVGKKFFLFVGVLRYYKGLHILIDAISNSNMRAVIIGTGPTEIELKKHAAKNQCNNIIFLGSLSDQDKVALLDLSYAIVFPSHLRSEAFGVSLLEGAMFGKPLISCEIGSGNSYINLHNQTGLVIPPSNPTLLRQAMQMLWDDPLMAANMGRQAKIRFQQLFTANKMMDEYYKLYVKCIEGYGSRKDR